MKSKQFSIKELLERQGEDTAAASPPPRANGEASTEPAAETLPPLDELSPLPGPGAPYVAYSRAANKMLPTLVLLRADASAKGFSYHNLDTVDLVASSEPGQGLVIVVRFTGIAATEVQIAGRHLDRLYNYLTHHRIGWIRQCPPTRDFIPPAETVITGISIKKVEG